MWHQGGGVTRHKGVTTYIDLIVSDFISIEQEFPQTADLFSAFAKHRQGPSNFGFAELDKDDRLHKALSATDNGRAFYQKLRAEIPLITVSGRILGDVDNVDNVQFFKLSDIEKDPLGNLKKIQDAVKMGSDADTHDFLDGIDRLNRIILLNPGFFGVSINLNRIIDDWLKKKRKQMAPDRSTGRVKPRW